MQLDLFTALGQRDRQNHYQ